MTVPIQGSPAAAHPAIFSLGPQAVEGFLVLDSGGLRQPAGASRRLAAEGAAARVLPGYKAKYNAAA